MNPRKTPEMDKPQHKEEREELTGSFTGSNLAALGASAGIFLSKELLMRATPPLLRQMSPSLAPRPLTTTTGAAREPEGSNTLHGHVPPRAFATTGVDAADADALTRTPTTAILKFLSLPIIIEKHFFVENIGELRFTILRRLKLG
jgi:hypothetical protein